MKKVVRTPVRVPKRHPVHRTKGADKKPKLRRDLLKEYDECIQKDGVVEVLTLADDDCLSSVRGYISTRSLELDRLLNGVGIPMGRVTEIFGPPHIGKSTVLDQIFAAVQQMGGVGVLMDTEGARDVRYTRAVGVDPEKLKYLEFERKHLHIEGVITKIYETVDYWRINGPEIPVVVGWDAIGGTSTQAELALGLGKEKKKDKGKDKTKDDDDSEESGSKSEGGLVNKPAEAAKVLRRACRQLPGKLGNTKIAVVLCNHEYQMIQMYGRVGKKRETYGGDAVRHLSSIRLQMFYAGESIKDSAGNVIGQQVGVRLVKNRLGNPWGKANIAIISGVGVDNIWSILRTFTQAGIISQAGGWSSIDIDGQVVKFQGRVGLWEKCREDPMLLPRLVALYKTLPT